MSNNVIPNNNPNIKLVFLGHVERCEIIAWEILDDAPPVPITPAGPLSDGHEDVGVIGADGMVYSVRFGVWFRDIVKFQEELPEQHERRRFPGEDLRRPGKGRDRRRCPTNSSGRGRVACGKADE